LYTRATYILKKTRAALYRHGVRFSTPKGVVFGGDTVYEC